MAKKRTSAPCPDYKDYLGAPGLYIEALRQHAGLSYRQLADTVQHKSRAVRKGSANYFYRLGKGQTRLRSTLVEPLVKALDLDVEAADYLRQAVRSASTHKNPGGSSGRELLRMLDASPEAQEQEIWLKTLIDPLIFAVYALAGSSRSIAGFVRAVARGASKKSLTVGEVRDAVAVLQKAGLLEVPDADKPQQATGGQDLMVAAAHNLADQTRREAMKHFYRQLDRWGGETLDTVEREKRYFASLTFLVEEEDLAALAHDTEKEWCALRDRLRTKYESKNGESAVHLGIREWPMVRLAKRLQGGTT